jgi:hypothetical protein
VTFAPRLRLNDLIERVPIESSGSRVGLLIDVFTQRRILSAFYDKANAELRVQLDELRRRSRQLTRTRANLFATTDAALRLL